MPKTLTGVKKAAYVGKAEVAVTGDNREDSNISGPVQALLDDAAYLLGELKTVTENLQKHGHGLASADGPGFMSQTDKAVLAGFSDALALHSHSDATLQKSGFFSKDEKKKLADIETGAQKVTQLRVEQALGILYGQITVPESSFSAGQTKVYKKSHQGVKYDAPISASETYKSDAFLMTYHVDDGEVEVRVRNLNSSSRTFPGGTIRYEVRNAGAP